MDINIINLSDVPAKISSEEIQLGMEKIISLGFSPIIHQNTFDHTETHTFNAIMSKDEDAIVLFPSGGIAAINHIIILQEEISGYRKILLGFSDLLHIQAIYHKHPEVESLYGITLRNIGDLHENEYIQLTEFLLKKRLSIPIDCISGNKDFSGKIFGGHLLIFSQIYEYFQFNIHNTLLYLEFHGMEEYMIEYIINILALKNIFSQITGIIFEENIDINIIHKFQKIGIKNVYKLKGFSYLPLFQEVIIEGNSLIYEKRYN